MTATGRISMKITDEISIPTTREIEADGFITPASALERASERKAKPISECLYPKCEECDAYHAHYCTVPMVVSKQIYLHTAEKLAIMDRKISEIENLLTDEILRSEE